MQAPLGSEAPHPSVVVVVEEGSGLADLLSRADPEGMPDSVAGRVELVVGAPLQVPARARDGLVVLVVKAAGGPGPGPEPSAFLAAAVLGSGIGSEIVADAPPAAKCEAGGVLSGVLLGPGPDPLTAGPGPESSRFFRSSDAALRFCETVLTDLRKAGTAHGRILIGGIAAGDGAVSTENPAALQAGRRLLRFVASWAGSVLKQSPAAAFDAPLPGIWLTASMEREARRLLEALAERTGKGGTHWMAGLPVKRLFDSSAPPKRKGKDLLRALRDLCIAAPIGPARPPSARSALEGIRRVYVEARALEHPASRTILDRLEGRERIVIGSYKSVLNRKGQSPSLQKSLLRAAVLGVKKGPLLYRQVRCSAPDGHAAYYASPVVGCLHHCRYCFVESKWGCGHLAVFVNHGDFVRAVIEKLQHGQVGPPPWIAFGYDSELLDFASLYPVTTALLDGMSAASGRSALRGTVEIITKSASTHPLDGRAPLDNLVLSYSLSPPEVWERFEEGTAPPEARLGAAADLLARGWKVGLRIDPVLPVRHCRELYGRFLRSLDARIPMSRVAFLQMGGLRFPESSGDLHYYRFAELARAEYAACLHDLAELLPRAVPAAGRVLTEITVT